MKFKLHFLTALGALSLPLVLTACKNEQGEISENNKIKEFSIPQEIFVSLNKELSLLENFFNNFTDKLFQESVISKWQNLDKLKEQNNNLYKDYLRVTEEKFLLNEFIKMKERFEKAIKNNVDIFDLSHIVSLFRNDVFQNTLQNVLQGFGLEVEHIKNIQDALAKIFIYDNFTAAQIVLEQYTQSVKSNKNNKLTDEILKKYEDQLKNLLNKKDLISKKFEIESDKTLNEMFLDFKKDLDLFINFIKSQISPVLLFKPEKTIFSSENNVYKDFKMQVPSDKHENTQDQENSLFITKQILPLDFDIEENFGFLSTEAKQRLSQLKEKIKNSNLTELKFDNDITYDLINGINLNIKLQNQNQTINKNITLFSRDNSTKKFDSIKFEQKPNKIFSELIPNDINHIIKINTNAKEENSNIFTLIRQVNNDIVPEAINNGLLLVGINNSVIKDVAKVDNNTIQITTLKTYNNGSNAFNFLDKSQNLLSDYDVILVNLMQFNPNINNFNNFLTETVLSSINKEVYIGISDDIYNSIFKERIQKINSISEPKIDIKRSNVSPKNSEETQQNIEQKNINSFNKFKEEYLDKIQKISNEITIIFK